MTGAVYSWVRTLCGAAAFCAVCLILCPGGRVKGVLKLVVGAVMAAALVSPLAKLDYSSFAEAEREYGIRADEAAREGEETAKRLERSIIEDECAAYILDKAEALGLTPEYATVGARWSTEGYFLPYECGVGCSYSAALSRYIASELGIPAERQHWEAGQ